MSCFDETWTPFEIRKIVYASVCKKSEVSQKKRLCNELAGGPVLVVSWIQLFQNFARHQYISWNKLLKLFNSTTVAMCWVYDSTNTTYF